MSTKKNATQFIVTDWILARKTWGANQPDAITGERGSTLYWPEQGTRSTLKSNDNNSALISFKVDSKSTDESEEKIVTYLAHYGGLQKFQELPDNAYINLNPDYDGDSRFMTTELFNDLCTEHKITAPTVVSLAQQVYQS